MSPACVAGQSLGEWVLDASLGKGGFAEVWRAHHQKDTTQVAALKVPHDPGYVARLKEEGSFQARIDSPHVARAISVELEHDPPFLVLELVEGECLRRRLEKGRLPEDYAVAIARQILLALRAAHAAGVVHRDLKPENVLVGPDGAVKVTDFGLGAAVDAEARELLKSGSLRTKDGHDLVGTVRYMSPEQRDPSRPIDHRADLYAWGVVLFEMLTGEPPSGSEVPSEVVPGLDPRLDRVFRHAYARLEGRYKSADEALAELDVIVASPRGPAAPETPALRLVRAGPLARGIAFAVDLTPFVILAYELRLLLVAPVMFLAYDAFFTTSFGASVGKLLLGLRVLDERGATLGPGAALARSFMRAVCALFVVPLIPLLGRDKRPVHDHLSATVVVHA